MRRVRRGIISSELIMCGGGVPRGNRCMYMAHACLYVCGSDCVWVCGNVV